MLTRALCTADTHAHKTFHAYTHRHSITYTTHTLIHRHTHTYTRVCTHRMHVLHTNIHSAHMYSCILCTSHIYHTTRYMWAYTPPGTNAAHKAHHPYQPRTTNACPESSQGPWAVGAERSPSTHTPCSLGAERPGSHSRGQTRAQYTQLPESRAARQGPGSGRRRSS